MSINKKKLFKPGFTLLELLVVIAILGILSTIGIGSFMSSQAKSRDARRKGDLQGVVAALEMFNNDKGKYPTSTLGVINGCAYDAGTKLYASCPWGGEWKSGAVVYFPQLPVDPSGNSYYYESDSDGSYYKLYALLENTKDKAASAAMYTGPKCTSSANSCNYMVKSTNK